LNNQNKLIDSLSLNIITDSLFSNIISSCLYQYDSGLSEDPYQEIQLFLINLKQDIKRKQINLVNEQNTIKLINTCKTILNISEGSTILTKNNLLTHLPNIDLYVQNFIINNIQNSKDINKQEFKVMMSEIIQNINIYSEVLSISNDLKCFDDFIQYSQSNDTTAFEAVKLYKDTVTQLYTSLNKLESLNKLNENKDYFIIDSPESVEELATEMIEYLGEKFSSFITNYFLFDNILGGIESSTVITLSAPSNHGKSLLLINLANNIIEENINNFEDGDAILIVTLEDDIKILLKRILSIFGNYDSEVIKYLYKQSNESISSIDSDNLLKSKFTKLMNNTIKKAIYEKTGKKVTLVIKHAPEDTFSGADLSNFILKLKTENQLNVKLVLNDYIDVMIPSKNKTNDKYKDQGTITQELRTTSKLFSIPVITATQNSRSSETNMQYAQSNSDIGDSYLKIRYSDIVVMLRMMDTVKDIFDDSVQRDCFSTNQYLDDNNNQLSPQLLKYKEQLVTELIPMEFRITKSKNSAKGSSKFMLFCKRNLKIYDQLDYYLNDLKALNMNSTNLRKEIDELRDLSISCVADDFLNNLDISF